MQLPQYILLSLLSVAFATEKCHFSDTVDLTNQTRFPNGSYLLQGRYLIPADKVANYSYRLASNQQKEPADLHVRGCVCDPTQQIYCVRLCCENGDMFNVTSSRCEKMPNNTNMSTDLEIHLKTNAKMSVNIFQHFVHQVALPCRNPVKVVADGLPWHLWENGTLHVGAGYRQLDTASYCLTPQRLIGSGKYVLTPMSCPVQTKVIGLPLLRKYGMAISVVFIIFTILLDLWANGMRNIMDTYVLFYLITMAIGYAITSFIGIAETSLEPRVCQALGFIDYFFSVSIYMCLSVVGMKIWKHLNCHYDFNRKGRFFFYSVYAWGSAGLMTAVVVWTQLDDRVADKYKPGIRQNGQCGLDITKWSAAIYFYGLNSAIIAVNIVIFVSLCKEIFRVRHARKVMTGQGKKGIVKILPLIRIFFMLGLTWSTDILAYFFRNYRHAEYMFVVSDFFHATRGISIFLLFVVKPSIWHKLKTRFSCNVSDSPEPQRECISTMAVIFSRLRDPIAPTTSGTRT